MKLIETKCPNCGASLKYDADKKSASCQFCGSSLIVDDETHLLKLDNGEAFGYQFEKGRQRAQAELSNNNPPSAPNAPSPAPKKRKTWLWVLGWIFIFPVPLTIILLKKPNMNKKVKYGIIAAAWIVYALLVVVGGISDKNDETQKQKIVSVQTTTIAKTTEENTTLAPTTIEPTTAASTTAAPTTIEPTTQKPTEKPTQKVTETPTPINVTNYTNVVDAGSNATVTIQGAPNTEYSISVYYSSGESHAEGLESKTSDENGYVTWEWEVGTKTIPGTYNISVTGGGTTKKVDFTVN